MVFRKTLGAVLSHLGPVGEVVDWILRQPEQVVAVAWREFIALLETTQRKIDEVLDWAMTQSDIVFRRVVDAIDAAGMVVSDVIDWAVKVGDRALEVVGEQLAKAGRSVDSVLLWVEYSAIGAIRGLVRGMIRAGTTVVDLMAWAANRAVQVVSDVVAELLEAGVALADIFAELITDPGNALEKLVEAVTELGRTVRDIVEVAVIQLMEEGARRVLNALKELGKTALEVLRAAAEVGLSALTLAFSIVLDWFPGSYRELTDEERTEAEKVFGTSIELDKVRLAVMSLPVDVIELVNNERPFTTMYLINFASWDELDDATLVHELTHVWQGLVAGPVYMVEALEAQFTEGYNYGYDNATTGEGGQNELQAANGDFSAFNREQQAQIMQHYYVRRYQEDPPLDWSAWQPYADSVQAA
jgi:hypothetical protein